MPKQKQIDAEFLCWRNRLQINLTWLFPLWRDGQYMNPPVTSLPLISPPVTGNPVLWTGWLYSMTKRLFLSIPSLTGHCEKTRWPLKNCILHKMSPWEKAGWWLCEPSPYDSCDFLGACNYFKRKSSKPKPAAVWKSYLQLIVANWSPNSFLDNYSQWC